jgi:hypothetical protein
VSTPLTSTDRTTPSGALDPDSDLARLVRELALTVQKRAIYPAAHPLLSGAVDAVHRQVVRAIKGRGVVSLGVARDRLIIDGVATDAEHPLVRELAERFHSHQIAAVHLHGGIERDEIDGLLSAVASAAEREGTPMGTRGPEALRQWPHINLVPVSFEHLEMLDDTDCAEAQQTWVGLAQVALGGLETLAQGIDFNDPVALAVAIDARRGDRDYERQVSAALLNATGLLDRGGGGRAGQLRSRVSSLLSSLDPATLARVLDMGEDAGLRARFMREATDHLLLETVVDVARAGASASSRTISDAMLRLFGKLARHSGRDTPTAAATNAVLRAQVHRMIDGWTLDDPNPARYAELLRSAGHLERSQGVDARRDASEPERVVDISCACDDIGVGTEHALAEWLARDGSGVVLERLMTFPAGSAREDLVDRLVNGPILREELGADRPDVRVLGIVVDRLMGRAAEALISAIAYRDERDAAWLSDLLVRTGADGCSVITRSLRRRAPFVQRALLGVLDRCDAWPSDEDLDDLTRHEDPGLRWDALRLMMKRPTGLEEGLLRAVRDPDERIVSQALVHAIDETSPVVGDAIMERMSAGVYTSADVRSRAVRAAAASGSDAVVPWLCDLALTKHWLLRYTKLRKSCPESVTAVAGLAEYWPDRRDAALTLLLARRSRDASYRHAVRRRESR